MDHVAVMRRSWGLTEKIVTGEKRIESRWYGTRYPPWDRIRPGETVYFKDSGGPVSVAAEVEKVLQISDLTRSRVRQVLDEYGAADGIQRDRTGYFYEQFKDKRYCLLIFLRNPRKVAPFGIDKRGFGMMAAWLCVDDIDRIRVR
jgi:hypothetical protein